MCKKYTIFALLLVTLMSGGAFSQDNKSAQFSTTLAPVMVTATRWEEASENVPDRVTVVTQEEIQKMPVRDVAEALSYMPGVAIDSIGGAGSVTFPSVQGSESYQTMVLINGIPFSTLIDGFGNLGQIPSEQIERVEVIHGAGGVQWGSAQGGLINVITHKPDRSRKNSVTAGGGDYGNGFGAVDFQHWTDKIGVAVGGGYRRGVGSEADRRNNLNNSGVGGLEAALGDRHKLNLMGFTFQGETGTGSYHDFLDGYYEHSKFRTTGGGASLDSDLAVGTLRLTGYYNTQSNNAVQFMVDQGQIGDTHTDDTNKGASAIYHAEVKDYTITTGVEGKNSETISTALSAGKYFLNSSGVFGNVERTFGNLKLQGGLRYSNEDFYGDFGGFNLGALYKMEAFPVDFRLSVAKGYSIPPLGYRFLVIPNYFVANPDLTTEKVISYELGAKARLGGGFTLDVNGFYAQLNDAIGLFTLDDGQLTYRNYDEFDRHGVEAEIKWAGFGGFSVFANTLHQEIRNKKTDTVVRDKIRATYASGVGYDYEKFSAQIAGNWKDYNSSERTKAKDEEWMWNAKCSYTVPLRDETSMKLNLSVFNITESAQSSNYLLPYSPPRQFEASVQYMF